MKTLGIIAANGQVGAEVSLFLSLRSDVKVVPISRSIYGSSLLRHCGLEVRHGSIDSPEDARRLAAGCDLLADFSVPRGTPPEVRATMRRITTTAINNSPDVKQYIYVGSHSIFREVSRQALYRSYAMAKRYAEGLAVSLGKKAGKEVYVLRLGQVHGVFQRVSEGYRAKLRDEEVFLPAVASHAVFAFSIAEALVNIAEGKETPGTYSLTAVPAWTWTEVHNYYCQRAGLTPRVRLEQVHPAGALRRLEKTVRKTTVPLVEAMMNERELADDVLATFAPSKAARLRAQHYVRRAHSELAEVDKFRWRPINLEYPVPGRSLTSLSDSRVTMHAPTRAVEELLESRLATRLQAASAAAAHSS